MGIINSKHLFFILSSLAIVTLKTFPAVVLRLGGRDSWISVIAASVLIILFVWLVTAVTKRTGNTNLPDIYQKTLGKVAGGFFTFLFMLTVLFSIFESSGAEASVMHESFMITTPIWVFIAVSAVCAVFIVKKGIASVTVLTVISIFLISISGTILGLLTQSYKETKYIFPILADGITPGFLLSIVKALGALSAVSVFLPYLDSIKEKRKLTKHCLIALLYIVQIQIFSMLGVITTFGNERAANLVFPKLTQTQIISAFGFLEAGELFVMLQVVGGWFIRYVVCFFALMELTRLSGIKLPFKEYVICALTVVFSYLFSKDMFDMFKILDYLLYIQLANFLVIPLIIYPIYYFKHKRLYGLVPAEAQDGGQQAGPQNGGPGNKKAKKAEGRKAASKDDGAKKQSTGKNSAGKDSGKKADGKGGRK